MGRAFKWAAAGLGALMALVAIEIGLRLTNQGFGNSPVESDPYLHHVHPRNYTFVQQHPSGELGGFEVRYDADGRVVSEHADDAPHATPPTCRIALMGDSFTEGGQVAHADSFAGRLERAAGHACEVRNYGVRSYSPAIYLVQWERDVRPWQPTHVFVLLFGNDIRDDAGYMAAATLDQEGFPLAVKGPGGGWLIAQLRQLYVARYIRTVTQRWQWSREHAGEEIWTVAGVAEENPDWTPLTARLVRELNRRVTVAGAQLTLMAVPSRYRLMGNGQIAAGDQTFHGKVEKWASENRIDFLALAPAFETAAAAGPALFFLRDIHYTAAGHAVTAAAIAQRFPDLFPDAVPAH